MRPANKLERHQLDERKERKAEVRPRTHKMPSYETWLRKQAMSGALPAPHEINALTDRDNLTGV